MLFSGRRAIIFSFGSSETATSMKIATETTIKEPLCNDRAATSANVAGWCFDCNICLDLAVDPVVTLCGHLYCWPCIYKWLQVEEGISPQTCPVCKASLSEDSLVPLYGRGNPPQQQEAPHDIPHRPTISRDNAVVAQSRSYASPQRPYHQHLHQHEHVHRLYNSYHGSLAGEFLPSTSTVLLGSPLLYSTAGEVLGEMADAMLPWLFRNNHEMAAESEGLHFTSSPHNEAVWGVGSMRIRRQEIQAERSLHQIWVFLLCCALLCLLWF